MLMDLVLEARRKGVLIYVDGGGLKARSAGDSLTPELMQRIRANKQDLIDLLSSTQPQALDDARLLVQETFWMESMRHAPPVHGIPLDRPRGESPTHMVSVGSSLEADLCERIDSLAVSLGSDRFHVLHAMFAVLVARWSGCDEVVVGSQLPRRLQSAEPACASAFPELLPTRVDIGEDTTLSTLLETTSRALAEVHENGDLPLMLIVDLLKVERETAHPPLMQLLFLEEDTSSSDGGDACLPSRFDLAVSTRRSPQGGAEFQWQFDGSIFDTTSIEALSRGFSQLLYALAHQPQESLVALEVVSQQEWEQIAAWNGTRQPFDDEARLHDLFATHVAATPDAIAVSCGEEQTTYATLDDQSGRLAALLQSRGVGPGSIVAVCLPRSTELMVAVLGVLKAGGAYLPVDPGYPASRIAYILTDSSACMMLAHSEHMPSVQETAIPTIQVDRLCDHAPIPEHGDAPPASTASDLAYLIYTSGSTGTPKGVALEHRGAVNLHANQVRQFGLSPSSRVLQFASIGFDAATWEWMMALLSGGALYLCPEDLRTSPTALGSYLVDQRITHATLPPALVAHMDPDGEYVLEALVVAGEACPESLREAWAGKWPLFNGYGPTEATVCASIERLEPDGRVSIGRPLDNLQIYLVDARMRLAPIGAVGELVIGGVALARCYVGNPQLTADHFLDCSLRDDHRQRLYRSGDMARYLHDGKLDFVGRKDDQVKLRGFRIEPREIEQILCSLPQVAHATVAVRRSSRASSLAAYVLPTSATHGRSRAALAGDLLEHLATMVPDYMVPSSLLVVESLPLTSNGKIDKRALLALDAAGAGEEFASARGEVEHALERIWCELLKLDRIGMNENFFAIGGDSILSIQAVARANQEGIPLTIRQLFEHTTIATIAADLAANSHEAAPVSDASGWMPLVPIQARFLEGDSKQSHHFNQSILLHAPADLQGAWLHSIASALVSRHDALRLTFPTSDNAGREAVHLDPVGYPVEEIVCDETMDDTHASFDAFIRERSQLHQRGFRLDRAPLFRMICLRGQGQCRLLLIAHHLIIDGVSWRILLQDLDLAYAQLSSGAGIALAPKTLSYQQWAEALTDYAAHPALRDEMGYWLEQSAGGPVPVTPDRKVSAPPVHKSTRYVSLELPLEQTQDLLRHCNKPYRTTINELLLAALHLGLQSFGSDAGDRLHVAIESHGREPISDRLDCGQTVGWFTSAYPVGFLVDSRSVDGVIKCIKEQYRRIPQGGLGYGVLRYLARNEELVSASQQEPQILFNYLGQFDSALSEQGAFHFADEETGSAVADELRRDFALGINGLVSSGKLRFTIDYSDEEFLPETVERLASALLGGISAVVEHCLQAQPWLTPSDFPLSKMVPADLNTLQKRYDVERLYPATFLQHGLLFHTLLDNQAYTSQIALSLNGPLQTSSMRLAWEAVAHRHDVLRTAIVGSNEAPHQMVARRIDLPWDETDLRHLEPSAQEEAFASRRLAQRRQGFDLEMPPLMRLSLFRLGETRYRLLWTHHHMLLDGWSLPIVYADVVEHYEALLAGRPPAVEATRPYEDYVAWLRRQDTTAAVDYWRDYLRGVESPTALSVDRLPAEADGHPRFLERSISPEATARLQDLARSTRTTLYTVLQYAWSWLLHKYSGDSTVVFGAIASGRPAELPDVERMVGLFINTLPVKVVVDPAQPIVEALVQLHLAFQQSAQFGYLSLADIRRQSGLPVGAPFFDSLLVLENYPLDDAIGADSGASLVLSDVDAFEETDYKLTLNASVSDRLSIRCSYHSDVMGDRVIERMLGHLESILNQLPGRKFPVGIEMMAPEEAQQLDRYRSAELPAEPRCIHERFQARALNAPDTVALVCESESVSYAELNARANRLARALRDKSVGAETLVGLCVDRGVEMLVGILGILKAGGAYVPIDPATPRARMDYMLQDSGIDIVVTERGATEILGNTNAELVLVDDAVLQDRCGDDLPPSDRDASPTSAAYVIYTSGSTGKPKGVVVEHRHVDRLFAVTERHFDFSERDVWTLFHSCAFDFSVWEIWGALLHGGKLVIVPKSVAQSPELFHALVAQEHVTVLNQTPAAFEQFSKVDERQESVLSLRYVIFGGAALDYNSLQPWMQRHPGTPRMINMYGITETTVHVTFREISRADVARGCGSMIGWPLADLTAMVFDPQGQPLPTGVAGELYVGGAGVSRGYLHRPELTAERFIPNATLDGDILYRTGDLVRRHESGELEYLGRIDNQVKIRGFRIELGEIESELNRVDLVRESLVLATGEGSEKRLVGYVVLGDCAAGEATVRESSERIRASISQELPDYMVPSVIMVVPAFPLNINGKIDRGALPSPDTGLPDEGKVEPRNDAERRMAGIWQETLGLPWIGVDDNFFAIGGDSIRAIPLISRTRQAGFEVSIKDLFESPTVALLSKRAQEARGQAAAEVDVAPFGLVDISTLAAMGYHALDGDHVSQSMVTRELHDAYPMTALQQGMVFHNLLSAEGTAYHDVMSFHVRAQWHESRFRETLQQLVDHHEMLRTVFDTLGETPLQLVLAVHTPRLEVIDLRHLEPDARETTITDAVDLERSSGFDYASPPWRIFIHLRGEGEFQYTLSFHHALLDGWSVANLNTQLFNGYLHHGAPEKPAPEHLPFRHYVQMEMAASDDPSVRRAWREKLDGVQLPWWSGKPKRQTLNGIQRLDSSVSRGLVQFAKRVGVQERSVLLAVHVALMALLDGRSDVVTSVVSNGRPEREGADSTLGLFLNSLPFRLEIADESWEQLVRRVDSEVAAYYAVRHLPLSEIQAESGMDFSASLFNYTNFHVYQSLDEQLDVLGAQGAEEKNYAISLSFSKAIGTDGPQFDVSIDVDSAVFPESFFRRIEGYVTTIAAHMASDGGAKVRLQDMIGAGERNSQLYAWNDNDASYRDLPVHRWFEAQVAVSPEAVAVTCGSEKIDYGTLNRRANQVARALVERGAGPGQRIGLCVQNSLEMMVGILGILKAGSAYIPLDPLHPRDRTRDVIGDAGMQLLLTQMYLQQSLEGFSVEVLPLDQPDWYDDLPADDIQAAKSESSLTPAYVIYTSGSTGRPKGVVVGHRALAMYLSHAQATYHAPHIGGSLVVTSFAFDLTKPALYLPLLNGGTVDLLDPADPLGGLASRIIDPACGDRLVRATPMHVQAMLDLMPADAVCGSRHAFVIGGEAFPPALAAALQQRFPASRVFNHYGPSEAVVGCAMFEVTPDSARLGDTLPLGRAMANSAIYILNDKLQPTPIGVPGILHVAGEGLADGYLGQPELTGSVFLRNPFADGALSRMYCTGDRARYSENGNLLFLGRADDQVKLRGFRIELGEIESLVRQLPFVREAAVAARGTGSEMVLVAYLVAHENADMDQKAIGEATRSALRARLPDYMIPGAVVTLHELPISANGKIDRRKLPDPDWSMGREFIAPEGDTEKRLARIWGEILRSEAVGATDNFFDLGGHSLKATRLVSAIAREFAVELPLLQVFQAACLREMARQIDQQHVRDANREAVESMPDMTEMEF